jgi:hemoglobin
MRVVHKHVNEGKYPTEDHFGAVAECLVATLKELNVAQELIDEVIAIVLTVKDDVLGL